VVGLEHLLGAGLSALLATEELCVGDMRSSLLAALEQLRALARLHPEGLAAGHGDTGVHHSEAGR
jgi:hypothetical protein